MTATVHYESEVMSLTEAAITCGVTDRTMRRWCDRGDVPTITLPNGRRAILREDLRGVVIRNQAPVHGRPNLKGHIRGTSN